MSFSRLTAILAVLTCALPSAGVTQEHTLTLDQALALARERAPVIIAARARVAEASGRLRGASVFLRDNPVIEGAAGNRTTPGEHETVDLRFGITQTFQFGERGARIDGAKAAEDHAIASAEQVTQGLLRDVATAFYRALYADARLRLAAEAESLSVDVVRIANRRYDTGDVARLDVNLARTTLSRARAEVHSAASDREVAVGDLRRLLGMGAEETVIVQGDLRNRKEFDLEELLARASERPDVRALVAEAKQAEADIHLGGAQRWPELTLGVVWEREETSEIGPLGVVGLSLPIFDHGQGLRDESRARSRRVQGEHNALQRSVAVEVQTAFSVYRGTAAAVDELEQNALPLLNEDEALVQRGYETGQLGLSELLLLRHEVIGTRIEYLARLLDAAVAGVELQMSAGVLK